MSPIGVSEQIYPFVPSQVFDRRTFHDIRARLGLTIPMDQLIAVLDHKLTIHLSLATSTNGRKFVRQTKDGEYHSDGPEGPKYSVLLQNLEGSIRNIVGKHIDGNYVGSDETFLRYQMKNDEMDYSMWSELLPVHELEFILPGREQVLALHHDWYVLPTQDGDGAVSNDESKNDEEKNDEEKNDGEENNNSDDDN